MMASQIEAAVRESDLGFNPINARTPRFRHLRTVAQVPEKELGIEKHSHAGFSNARCSASGSGALKFARSVIFPLRNPGLRRGLS